MIERWSEGIADEQHGRGDPRRPRDVDPAPSLVAGPRGPDARPAARTWGSTPGAGARRRMRLGRDPGGAGRGAIRRSAWTSRAGPSSGSTARAAG